ncbi:MAG TPA: histidine kinase [Acidimicrobiales bacterium]|nr:histidine kinase [Acidimicrobiales bacterium]
MPRWSRWRADLARPVTPTDPAEVLFVAVSTVVIVLAAQATDAGTTGELLLVVVAGACLLGGAVGWLPWEATAVLVSLPLAAATGRSGNLEVAFFLGVLVSLYAAWHLGSLTRAVVVLVVSVAVPLTVAAAVPEEDIAWTPWVAANVFTFLLGRDLGRQRLLIERLEAAREALAQQAVAEERRRIARDLHDLAGHTLAAVLLHVTGARHVLRRDVDEAERALLQAETVGRASLDQIRATVASLRTSERGTDPALPGSADVMGLVDDYRRAGLDVTAVVTPAAASIEGPLGVALHRICGEALANVARHAPGNRVELAVDLDAATDEVRLVVADHGRAAAGGDHEDGHFGLVGMRERARAVGGELAAGPTPGGWRVEARLPLAATDRERSVP